MAPELRVSARAPCAVPDTGGISGHEIQRWDLIPFPAVHRSWKPTRQLELSQASLPGGRRRNVAPSCAAWERGRGGRGGAARRGSGGGFHPHSHHFLRSVKKPLLREWRAQLSALQPKGRTGQTGVPTETSGPVPLRQPPPWAPSREHPLLLLARPAVGTRAQPPWGERCLWPSPGTGGGSAGSPSPSQRWRLPSPHPFRARQRGRDQKMRLGTKHERADAAAHSSGKK